jgi:hypothetical protein
MRRSPLLIIAVLGCGGRTPAPAPAPAPEIRSEPHTVAPAAKVDVTPAPAPAPPTPPAPMPVAWMRAASGNNYLEAVAIRPDGSIVAGASDDGSGWLAKPWRKSSASGAVIALDASGKTLWVRPTGSAEIRAVQALADGGVIACGDFDKKLIVDGKTLATANGARHLVVLALDGAGKIRWTFATGGKGSGSCRDIAVMPDGKLAIVGSISGEAMFGELPAHAIGDADMFVAVLDATGHSQWVGVAGGTESDKAASVAIAGSAIYVTGDYGGDATFGTHGLKLARGAGQHVANPSNIFVARYTAATGELEWVTAFGVANSFDRAWAITALSDGGSAVIGAVGDRGFVARYDVAGNQMWIRKTAQQAAPRAILALPNDELLVAAYFGWPQAGHDVTFRGTTREITLTAGGSDSALVRFSATGELVAAGRLAGATPHSYDERNGSELEMFHLARGANGRIVAAGRLWGSGKIEGGDLLAPSQLTASVPDRGGVVAAIDPAP